MPQDAYPYDEDLLALLTSAGLDVPESLDLQAKCDAAIAWWEDRTGWHPYLSDGNVETRLFDPPCGFGRDRVGGRSLFLSAGLLSLTSLAVGVIPNPQGVYTGPGTAGTLLTNNLNFYLRPQNAAVRGLPFTEVEFLAPLRGIPQSIAITGVWGRTPTVPSDVWQAILQKAAALSVAEIALSISHGLYELREGDAMSRFSGTGASPLSAEKAMWESFATNTAKDKKRLTC